LGGRKRIRVRLKANDPESLARSFAPNVDTRSVFLGVRGDVGAGDDVTVELQYQNGSTALFGEGRVREVREGSSDRAGGLDVEISWTAASLRLVERIKAMVAAHSRELIADLLPPPASDVVSTEYASYDTDVRDELGPAPIPNALNADTAIKQAVLDQSGDLFDDVTASGWEHLSGEVTPLARIDLVRKSTRGITPWAEGDIEDSGGFERPNDLGDAVRSKASRAELPAKSRLAIGIDLGTTHCQAAIVIDAVAQMIPTRTGLRTMPSAVTIYLGGRTIVGEPALRQQPIHPANTIVGMKRLMGRPFHSKTVQKVRERYAYEIVEGDEGDAAVKIGRYRISFEEITALILKEVRQAASRFLGEIVNRAVITCPAYYNERQREAVRTAGELAGFHVERLLNEPTAAAINNVLSKKGDKHKRRLLVYDLGGGTFDASLIEVDGDVFSVVATGGDTLLGGLDFDACLAAHAAELVRQNFGVDPSIDPMAMARLSQAAEIAKRELGASDRATIRLEHFFVRDWQAPLVELEVKRAEVDRMFDPLIERTLVVCHDVLGRAKVSPKDLDDLILVGGQCRSRLVLQRVREMFDRQPVFDEHPDETVALGAAHYAQTIGSFDGLRLVDALPVSIGIGLPGARYLKIIARDTRLPTKKTHRLATTRDGQSVLEIVVFQGEDADVFNNELLGMLRMTDLPTEAAGEIAVTVSFELTEECILRLSATEERTGRVVATEFKASGTLAEIEETLSKAPSAPEPTASERPTADAGEDGTILDWLKTRLGRAKRPTV
jgi:molecular chaperone DnaK